MLKKYAGYTQEQFCNSTGYFLSLTPKQQESLIDEWGGVIIYTPDQEAMIMSSEDWLQDVAKTLLKVEKVKKMV